MTTLSPSHLQQLVQGSGIAPEVIAARGHYTATDKSELATLQFKDYQQRVPALVFPVYDVHGHAVLHQIRPDHPRKNKRGRALKYDTPEGQHLVLDVHPAHGPLLTQASVPLLVLEGLKKKDAVVSRLVPDQPLCPVGLIGTWGWMRDKRPLPDWQAITLKDRQVLLVYDSDVTTTREVGQARTALATFLQQAGAHVSHIDFPALPGGKCGADDYLVAGHTLHDLLSLAQETFPQPQPLITTLADVEETAMEWLWWPYLPKAALVMVDGDPGTGKSLWTIQLAASLSRGWAFPDQQGRVPSPTGQPHHTLLMSAEDSVSATIKKRCRECGGDDRKLHLFTEWRGTDGEVHPFTLQDIALLDTALRQRPCTLLVIDPIQAFLGDIDMHRSNETRPVLQALSKVLERHTVTALCIRHPAKPGQGASKAIYRGLGSIDFIGAGRSGIFVEQHPVEPQKVLMAHMKSNVGPLGRTQIFTKAEGIFAWAGVSRLSAELVAGNARGPDPLAFFEAYCWLESQLDSGVAYPSQDLLDQAQEEGIAEKTLKRAKKALGVRSTKQGDVWYWRLPSLPVFSPPPSLQPGPLGSLDLHGPLGPLDPLQEKQTLTVHRNGACVGDTQVAQDSQVGQVAQEGQEGQVSRGATAPVPGHGAPTEACPQCHCTALLQLGAYRKCPLCVWKGHAVAATTFKVGDTVRCVNEKGEFMNAALVTIKEIVLGPKDALWAMFHETTTGWPLSQCEREQADAQGVPV